MLMYVSGGGFSQIYHMVYCLNPLIYLIWYCIAS